MNTTIIFMLETLLYKRFLSLFIYINYSNFITDLIVFEISISTFFFILGSKLV